MNSKYFAKAWIYIQDGCVIVNAKKGALERRHDNVTIERISSEAEYVIRGKKVQYDYLSWSGYGQGEPIKEGEAAFVNYEDDQSEKVAIYSFWPFGKKYIRILKGWCLRKERKQMRYTTNNIIIIE